MSSIPPLPEGEVMPDGPLPLADVKIIDIGTLLAAPFAAAMLADFGAEVIKIEQPAGDPLRGYGHRSVGVALLWKVVNRNKKSVIMDLKDSRNHDKFLELVADADVLIENFRPGTLERWGLSPAVLHEVNPQLVVTRVTGFGQDGPYAGRPGFGTLAEAMSGLAAISGERGGPPLLPAFPLADALAGLHAACATLIALHARPRIGGGQVADVAITEAMIAAMGAQVTAYDKLGIKPERVGNGSDNNSPRNVYRCADERWVAVSAPAQSVAERVIRLVGRPELTEEPWFATGRGRAAHRETLDDALAQWVGRYSRDEVIAAFEQVGAAAAPIYEVDDVLRDPHFLAREVTVRVPDDELDSVRIPNVAFRLSATPGRIRWAGPRLGEHTDDVLNGRRPMTATVEEQRWQLLDPAIDPADPDEYLRTAVRWHFGAETGSPFWLRRARQLDFDPLTDIRTFDDLRLFPNIVDELRTVPVEELIPRGYGPNPAAPRVFESGGTTGAPKRAILMPDWIASAVDRMLKGPQFADRAPSNILVLTPTGPHKIGCMYDYIAERQNTVKFCIDMDPRWVKKLVAENKSDEVDAYVRHILDQAEHILATQRVGLLVTTPPVLRACIRRPRLTELI
ncbi:CoA transferase, partial [Nocardia sp. NPDC004604]|uniref:CaiB/BaiF CoA transferase family protein n=1 Tax=Nocardia sp. NPDC004604 TaxID=3157013 RepID=UPI0033AA8B20